MSNHLVVIGGLSGIGKAVVDIASNDPGFSRVTALGDPSTFAEDVRLPSSAERMMRSLIKPPTHVVYSVGRASLEMIPDLCNGTMDRGLATDEFEDVFDVNVFGFLRILSALVRSYPSGRVTAVVSDAMRTPMRGSIAYCSSKAALAMAIKVAARELAPQWMVNGVAPGMVDGTPMTRWIDATIPVFRGWTAERAREYEMSNNPMGRRLDVNEVAQVVLGAVCGNAMTTGSIIEITGGK